MYRHWLRRASLPILVSLALVLSTAAGELRHPLLAPGNVRVGDEPAVRAQALWALTGRSLMAFETRVQGESADAFSLRVANTRRLLLRIAWFESVQLRYRKQVRGPARSFYQIEPIRAVSCCQMAERRGWMDDLAIAAGRPKSAVREACTELTPSGWPSANLIEQSLSANDRFATVFARICLEPIPDFVPGDAERQAEWWANRWKRAFTSHEQRANLIARFVQAAAEVDALLAESQLP